jgi:predicted phage tail protein
MKPLIKIILGIVAVMIGMAFVMPAVAQWKQEGGMTALSVMLCLLGAVMTLAGIAAAIQGIAKRNA